MCALAEAIRVHAAATYGLAVSLPAKGRAEEGDEGLAFVAMASAEGVTHRAVGRATGRMPQYRLAAAAAMNLPRLHILSRSRSSLLTAL